MASKLQFNGAPRRCLFESFYVAFFKKRPPIQRAERWSPPQRRNSFCGISFLLSFFLWASGVKEKSGQTVTISKTGFLFLRKPFCAQHPLFFCYRWRKRKAWQKKTPWFVSPLRRRPTLHALDRRRLLKKAGENFYADIAVKSPTNQNLKHTKRLDQQSNAAERKLSRICVNYSFIQIGLPTAITHSCVIS